VSTTPQYLCVELPTEHANQVAVLEEVATLVAAGGGTVHAHAPAGRVSCLEPGTNAAGLLLASWLDSAALSRTVTTEILPHLRRALPSGSVPTVLQANGLPKHGLPEMLDIPTVASVAVCPPEPRNALMLIRGTAFIQERLDLYRDVILPMLKQRGGYYEVFALAEGEIKAWSGEWNEQIFAISRWPTRAAAEDFWFSDRYQRTAIPLRLNGAGRFSVNLLDATPP